MALLFPEEFQNSDHSKPLAERMRPKGLEDFVGQDAIFEPGSILASSLTPKSNMSLVLWGPPGSGKTTLARIYAKNSQRKLVEISAVHDGVAKVRQAIQGNPGGLLFIDEIHRFSKSQQDSLLPNLERGDIVLVAATTENPYFYLQKALLSRTNIIRLHPLSDTDITQILSRTIEAESLRLSLDLVVDNEVFIEIAAMAQGDARRAISILETLIGLAQYQEQGLRITLDQVSQYQASVDQQQWQTHTESERQPHRLSAFIKSMRGSDPDAALIYLVEMIEDGVDPRAIMRRLLVFANEDVGLADPRAIQVVSSCAQALEWCGMPESKYHLSMATLYLATAPKSNTTKAYFAAERHFKQHGPPTIPSHLKNTPQTQLKEPYNYPHDHPNHWVPQEYLPQGYCLKNLYKPSTEGFEQWITKFLADRPPQK